MWLKTIHWRRVPIYTSFIIVSALLGVALRQTSMVRSLDLRALDAEFVLRGKAKPSNIVLLVIDQKTYDNIPDVQLFWHPYYAEAIRAVADGGAKVMALDIAFTIPVEKWQPDHDRILAEALAETSPRLPIVCGYVPAAMTKQQEWPIPFNIIASAQGLSAFVNLTADDDSFVRRQELIEAPATDQKAPLARALSLRAVERYLGKDAEFDGKKLVLNEKEIPILPDRSLAINFAGPANTFPSVSLWDFLQAARAGDKRQLEKLGLRQDCSSRRG